MARPFPYKKNFMRDPVEIFKDLLDHTIKLEDPKLNKPFGKYVCNIMYYKQETGNMLVDDTDYEIDILSDYYQEHVRVQCKKLGRSSIYDFWQSNPEYFTKGLKDLSDRSVREAIYEKAGKKYECTQFKCTVSKAIFDMFKSKNVLDFSAGYGDRLLGAIAAETVETYLAYDPNTKLKEGHSAMINTLCPIAEKNKKSYKVIYEPFETAELEGQFDMVFTSPPFFGLEIYSTDSTQSSSNYYSFNKWMKRFLFKALDKSWNNLVEEGYMAIYIGNYENINIIEPMNLYMEMKNDSSYWGCLSFSSTNTKKRRYIWVWQKSTANKRDRIRDAKRLAESDYMFLF